tara:strand:+ start:314 stop:601 length:288 start_codon:yes stop_codon:yes gene_type:complete
MTEGDTRYIKWHTKKSLEELNVKSNKLVDVLDPSRKTRNGVISKLKKLILVIGPTNKEDWDFVNTLTDSIVMDGGVPTELELKQCNNLWRKYNVK